jgi:ABC-type sugar transport system ATPase subunit
LKSSIFTRVSARQRSARGQPLAPSGRGSGAGRRQWRRQVDADQAHRGRPQGRFGRDPLEWRRARSSRAGRRPALGIETVYQDLALADELSVGANVFLGREPIKRWLGLPVIDNRKIRDETEALLKRIESRIPPKSKTVSRLSGGQRQAVAIARALYWQSKVVILDEPTAALAVMEREHVIQLARKLAEHGVGVIYIGHNLIEILEVADRVAAMFRGRITHVTPAAETNQRDLIKYMTGYEEAEATEGAI